MASLSGQCPGRLAAKLVFVLTVCLPLCLAGEDDHRKEVQYDDYSYRVNCGGPGFKDEFNGTWLADDQSANVNHSVGGFNVNSTSPENGFTRIYSSAKVSSDASILKYSFHVEMGMRYLLRLYFFPLPLNQSRKALKKAIFSVVVNGEALIPDYEFSKYAKGRADMQEIYLPGFNTQKAEISFIPIHSTPFSYINGIELKNTKINASDNKTDRLYGPFVSSNMTVFSEYRINCAGKKAIFDALGRKWSSDEGYMFPSFVFHTNNSVKPSIISPMGSQEELYKSQRAGDLRGLNYWLNVTMKEEYIVRLHFADISNASDVIIDQSGSCDILINDYPVKIGYNMTFSAGKTFVADIQEFHFSSSFSDTLRIKLLHSSRDLGTDDGPSLAAIEVYRICKGTWDFLVVKPFTPPAEKTVFPPELSAEILTNFKGGLGNPEELSSWNLTEGKPCLSSAIWKGIGCKEGNITSLILPYLDLGGTLDSSLGSLITLEYLWLYGNTISGSLPPQIGNLSSLMSLRLHNNSFSGDVPLEFGQLKNLHQLTLNNNHLTGAVPYPLLNLASLFDFLNWDAFVRYTPGNPDLCAPLNSSIRADLPLCEKTETDMELGPEMKERNGNSWVTVAAVLGSFGSLLLLVTAVLGGYMLGFRRHMRTLEEEKEKEEKEKERDVKGGVMVPLKTQAWEYFRKSRRQNKQVVPTRISAEKNFTLSELQKATQNFSGQNLLGSGGFGKVYRGILPDGTFVAIKRHVAGSGQGFKQFYMELETLSKVRHRHLVSLIGFCQEAKEMILVYEYMPRGTLRDHLPPLERYSVQLSWEKRLEIAIGAGKGLDYLHSGLNPPLIHRDVKSTNILIDADLSAKVGDFGLTRIGPTEGETHVSTAVRGSFGYLDPEYYKWLQLTKKSDVYSFGVVLLELMAGRKVIDLSRAVENSQITEVNLVEWSRPFLQAETLNPIVDKSLNGNFQTESMELVGKLVLRCLQEQAISRPGMDEVLRELETALRIETKKKTKENCEFVLEVANNEILSSCSNSSLSSEGEFHPYENCGSPRLDDLSS